MGDAISVADQDAVRVDVIQALGAIAEDRELLQRSADLARQVEDGTLPAEEAASQIARDSPEVASVLRRWRGAALKVLIWVLLTAITILANQAVAELRDHSATPADVERIVHRAFQDCYSQQRPLP